MKQNNLKMLRKKMKLSQKELAKIVNISQSMLSNLERGSTRLDVETALKFAEFYGVSIEELVSESLTNTLPLSDNALLDLPPHIKDKLLLNLLEEVSKKDKKG